MKKQEVIEILLKYLNSLCFSGKYTAKTSLNYMSDLNQYFTPLMGGKFELNSIKSGLVFTKILHLKNSNLVNSTGYWASSEAPIEALILKSFEVAKPNLASLAAVSRRRKLSALKNFATWCVEQKILTQEPSLPNSFSKIPSRLPEYLNLDEILTYFKSIDEDFKKEPDKYKNEMLNFLVLYGCGLRTEEACQIQIKDIDFKNSRISVLGKGQKYRFAIMPEFMIQFLETKITKSDKYIYGPKPLNPRTAYNWIKRRALKAGLHKPVHPHMFRHSYATHLLREKTDLRHLQELLGHSSLAATQRYTHLDKAQLLQSLEDFHPLSKE